MSGLGFTSGSYAYSAFNSTSTSTSVETMVQKGDSRRVRMFRLLVPEGSRSALPLKAGVTVKRPRGGCWPWSSSRKVAAFTFKGEQDEAPPNTVISAAAPLDLEHLFGCYNKGATVKISAVVGGRKLVARDTVDHFVDQLVALGHDDVVNLQLSKAAPRTGSVGNDVSPRGSLDDDTILLHGHANGHVLNTGGHKEPPPSEQLQKEVQEVGKTSLESIAHVQEDANEKKNNNNNNNNNKKKKKKKKKKEEKEEDEHEILSSVNDDMALNFNKITLRVVVYVRQGLTLPSLPDRVRVIVKERGAIFFPYQRKLASIPLHIAAWRMLEGKVLYNEASMEVPGNLHNLLKKDEKQRLAMQLYCLRGRTVQHKALGGFTRLMQKARGGELRLALHYPGCATVDKQQQQQACLPPRREGRETDTHPSVPVPPVPAPSPSPSLSLVKDDDVEGKNNSKEEEQDVEVNDELHVERIEEKPKTSKKRRQRRLNGRTLSQRRQRRLSGRTLSQRRQRRLNGMDVVPQSILQPLRKPSTSQSYQLRVIVHRVDGASKFFEFFPDVYVKARIFTPKQPGNWQRTDVHHKCVDGLAVFEYRLVLPTFTVELPGEGRGKKEREPMLEVVVMDEHTVMRDSKLGSVRLSLKELVMPVEHYEQCGLNTLNNMTLNLFSPSRISLERDKRAVFPREVTGYWPVIKKKKINGELRATCSVKMTLQLLTMDEVKAYPAESGNENWRYNQFPTLERPVREHGHIREKFVIDSLKLVELGIRYVTRRKEIRWLFLSFVLSKVLFLVFDCVVRLCD